METVTNPATTLLLPDLATRMFLSTRKSPSEARCYVLGLYDVSPAAYAEALREARRRLAQD